MQIVIDIPEETYKATCDGCMLPPDVENVVQGIKNGTPLPDGAEILTKEAYSDLCTRAADVPNFESEEYVEKRLENYNALLKSGILDCVKYSSTTDSDSSTDSTTVSTTVEPAKCGDCISRQIISDYVESHIQEINTGYGDLNKHTNEILRMIGNYIESMPSVEPERKSGKWIWEDGNIPYCSNCKKYSNDADEQEIHGKVKFCSHCGSVMEEEDVEI